MQESIITPDKVFPPEQFPTPTPANMTGIGAMHEKPLRKYNPLEVAETKSKPEVKEHLHQSNGVSVAFIPDFTDETPLNNISAPELLTLSNELLKRKPILSLHISLKQDIFFYGISYQRL
jgi:hypothetical protein